MNLGGNPAKSGGYAGEIAEVSVYNRALSAKEVKQLYDAGPQAGKYRCSANNGKIEKHIHTQR